MTDDPTRRAAQHGSVTSPAHSNQPSTVQSPVLLTPISPARSSHQSCSLQSVQHGPVASPAHSNQSSTVQSPVLLTPISPARSSRQSCSLQSVQHGPVASPAHSNQSSSVQSPVLLTAGLSPAHFTPQSVHLLVLLSRVPTSSVCIIVRRPSMALACDQIQPPAWSRPAQQNDTACSLEVGAPITMAQFHRSALPRPVRVELQPGTTPIPDLT